MPSVPHRLTQISSVFPVTKNDDKIKPGFHSELLRSIYAAHWLENSMVTDLAKLQLFFLNDELLRLHGRCANFSPEIIKHNRMNDNMKQAQYNHDLIVHAALMHVRERKKGSVYPSSLPPPPPPPPPPPR